MEKEFPVVALQIVVLREIPVLLEVFAEFKKA